MSTIATRRSSVARRAADGAVAEYLWERSSRITPPRRPAARRSPTLSRRPGQEAAVASASPVSSRADWRAR
jgi:hypothetical protein